MGKIVKVPVSNLMFWLENFRFGEAVDQRDALKKLKSTKNFDALVSSIEKYGFQYNNLLTVSPDKQNQEKYLVYDGNRRLAAVKQIPTIKDLSVYVETDRAALNAILDREHNSSAKAGRLRWTSVQQARRQKALHSQDLTKVLSTNAICLNIIETSTGESLDSNFPLTTFSRLYESYKGFNTKLDIRNDGEHVGKTDEIKKMANDIEQSKINSRNINTTENINQYMKALLSGKSQEERTNLTDDNSSEEEVESEEEQHPTRLFRPTMLDKLKPHIKNQEFMYELGRAPINRYPHLLFLGLRCVLDTLHNINKNTLVSPKSLSSNDIEKYIQQNHNLHRKKISSLLDKLAEHSHNARKKSTKAELDNARPHIEVLIDNITDLIKNK